MRSEPLGTWRDDLAFRKVERWKREVDAASASLGEAVDRLHLEGYLPPSEKA